MARLISVLALVGALILPRTFADVRARNVILFLADAGGLPTLNAASIYGHGAPQKLFINTMPHIALSDTSSASRWVTDSAAGMTAIVTGRRTENGVLAQSDAAEGQEGRRAAEDDSRICGGARSCHGRRDEQLGPVGNAGGLLRTRERFERTTRRSSSNCSIRVSVTAWTS